MSVPLEGDIDHEAPDDMRLGRRSGLYRRRWMRRERVSEKGNDDFDAGRENDHYHRERSEEDREEPPRRYPVNAMKGTST